MKKKNNNDKKIYPITNMAVFSMVMEDPEICGEFLSFALKDYDLGFDFSNLTAESITSEKTFVSVNLRSTRIDIFINGDEYYANLEMQNRKVKGYHLPKRSKYHHAVLTLNQLGTGDDFDDLKPTIVIFVCMYDEVGLNLPKYIARTRIDEAYEAEFDDGTITVMLNIAYRGDDLPADVKAVYDYFRNGDCTLGSEMVQRIDDRVHEVNDTGKENIMTFEQAIKMEAISRAEEMAEEMAEEKAKGMAENMAKDIANKMLSRGFSSDEICELTGLCKKEIDSSSSI